MEALIIPAFSALFILLKPFIDAWIIQSKWTPKQKSLVAWGTSIVLGTLFVLVTGGLGSIQQILIAIPAVYGYSQAIYQFLVKNIATKFEALTTKDSAVVAPAESGTVTITTDETIKAETDNVPVETPVTISTTPDTPVEIVKTNVVG